MRKILLSILFLLIAFGLNAQIKKQTIGVLIVGDSIKIGGVWFTSISNTDTTSLSNRIDTKLNKSDTANSWRIWDFNITNYLLRSDTSSLSNRIDLKLDKSDTSNNWRKTDFTIGNYLLRSDTSTLSARIERKADSTLTGIPRLVFNNNFSGTNTFGNILFGVTNTYKIGTSVNYADSIFSVHGVIDTIKPNRIYNTGMSFDFINARLYSSTSRTFLGIEDYLFNIYGASSQLIMSMSKYTAGTTFIQAYTNLYPNTSIYDLGTPLNYWDSLFVQNGVFSRGLSADSATILSRIIAPVYKVTSVTAIADSTIDCNLNNQFSKTLGATQRFVFTNFEDGQTINVSVTNTASNYTVTWVNPAGLTILWSGGTAPTQTIGAKTDIYTFIRTGTNIFGAYIQNF